MQVHQTNAGGFQPIKIEIVLESQREVDLFRSLVSNNVTIPQALSDVKYIKLTEEPALAAIMSKLNTFVG